MCECGCASAPPDFQFKGPDGLLYTLQIHRPCRHCETPLGVIIARHNPEEVEEWGLDQLPELPWGEYEEAAFPLVYPKKLLKELDKKLENSLKYVDRLEGALEGRDVIEALAESQKEK